MSGNRALVKYIGRLPLMARSVAPENTGKEDFWCNKEMFVEWKGQATKHSKVQRHYFIHHCTQAKKIHTNVLMVVISRWRSYA